MFFDKRNISLGFLAFLLLSVIILTTDVLADPLATCDTLSSSDVEVFLIKGNSGDYGDEIPCTVQVDLSSWSDDVQRIEMRLTWAPGDLDLDSVDFSPWLQNHPGSDTQTVTLDNNQGVVSFLITGFDDLIGYEDVVLLWFEIECFSTYDPSEVVFDRDCNNTHFGSDGALLIPWWIFDNSVSMKAISHTMAPKGDSSTVNQFLDMPVKFTCERIAENGFGSSWQYPRDSLDVDTVIKGSLISSDPGWSVNESVDPAKLHIYYTGQVDSTSSPETIFTIRFKNTMNVNYSKAEVTRKTDTLKFCNGTNSNLYSVITTPASDTATTFYEAKFSFDYSDDTTNCEDAEFPVMLSNNFWVRLKDSACVSQFRINDSEWDYITWDGYGSVSGSGWEWNLKTGAGDKWFNNNEDDSDSNIRPQETLRDVSIMFVDCASDTGTDLGSFRSDTTMLRDSASIVTIYMWNGIDTASGAFAVKEPPESPGGPGCPFLYVWNGIEFKEENTILAASEINPGKLVTDYYLLSKPLVPKDDRYVVQIREFESEVSYLDQVRLVAVDHSPEIKVGVTTRGKIFGYDKELVPVGCVDQNGKDHLAQIKSKDGVYFVSEEPGYLIAIYDTKTLWTDDMGDSRPIRLYDSKPPIPKKAGVISNVVVEIQDINGNWHNLGDVLPRFYPDRSMCILGTDNVELADEFKVKISWDRYYSADELKYYVQSKEKPIKIWSCAVSAFNSETGKVLELLTKRDEQYATLMPGQDIELSFRVTSISEPDIVRDFVLQTEGYYISLKKREATPSSFALFNNYPNPFNASTEISYTLPQEVDVKLEIYNVLGQKVRVLVSQHQSAGYQRVKWDGRDDKGKPVSTGVYLYRLQAGDYTNSKKMLYLK